MEEKDLALLQKLRLENEELNSLWVEHVELEKRANELGERIHLSNEEQMELKRIKKVKLVGRDRIDKILADYRTEYGEED